MSMWRMTFWTDAERRDAAASVAGAIEGWRARWGIAAGAVRVAGAQPDSTQAGWTLLGGEGDGAAAWWQGVSSVPMLADALWGDGHSGRVSPNAVAQTLARQAATALQGALCAALDLAPPPAGDETGVPALAWRGGLQLELGVGDRRVGLLLGADLAHRVVRRIASASLPTPLTPIARRIASRRMTLAVRLQPLHLSIGDLCGLAPGDVLALPHDLAAPVSIVDPQGQLVAQAHLVRRARAKAVQLIESPDAIPAGRATHAGTGP